jgi:putative ABC transport system permease protein
MVDLERVLRRQHKIRPGGENDFTIRNQQDVLATQEQATQVFTSLLASIAAVSLVVGGIGIMNIMLVSVTERTREIGIRLAIGAVAREVLLQFLVEAIALSCLGGVIGLIVAQAAIAIIAPLIKVQWLFVPEINIFAFAISAVIGVVFGYFPARRAAAMNPIDALRHE